MRRRIAPACFVRRRIPRGRSIGAHLVPDVLRRLSLGSTGLVAALCLAPAVPWDAAAEDEPDAHTVELDKLLELPDSLDYGVEQRGGLTRSEWQARFQDVRSTIEGAETRLARAQEELEGLASETGQWQLAPPGAGAANAEAPLSYRLRQDIRRHRAERDRATHQLRDLQIEANLAGVPESWREEPAPRNGAAGPHNEASPDHPGDAEPAE